jgi:4-hydroxy-2-oxoglutarate aldolase
VVLYNLPGDRRVVHAADRHAPGGPSERHRDQGTSPDIERLGQFAGVRPDRFRVLCGCAPVVYPALVSGAVGAILAVANVLPEECCALYDHVKAGRHHEALELQRKLTPLAQLVTTVHGVAGLKVALELAGYHGGPVRTPLLAATSRIRDDIAAATCRRVERSTGLQT